MSVSQVEKFKPSSFIRLVTTIKSRYTALTIKVNEIISQKDAISQLQRNTLRNYLVEINNKYSDFERNFHRALDYDENDSISDDTLTQDQDTITDMHTYLVSAIDMLIGDEEFHTSVLSTSSTTPHLTEQCFARLPKLELIKFNGDFAQWTTFINLFNTTIHHNHTLNKVLKFQYLMSVLSDEPLNLVRNLQLTEQNYDVAYGILLDRYQNDRRLQLLHINRVIDLPDISANNITGIRKFLNTYHENIQALTAIHCDISDSKHLLSALLLRKLDVTLRKRLEVSRDNDGSKGHTMPTTLEIITFLNKECDRHEDAIGAIDTQLNEFHFSSNSNRAVFCKDTRHKSVVASNSITSNQFAVCAVCDTKEHKTFAFHKFLSKTPQERYQIIKARHHCISCLGVHSIKECKSTSTCKICHKQHNTLLHFSTDRSDNLLKLPSNSITKPHNVDNVKSYESINAVQSSKTVTLTTQNSKPSSVNHNMVLLGTILIKVCVDNGITQTFRALLDSGSMCSLISERAVSLLNASRHSCNIKILGINQHVSRNKGQVFCTIQTPSGTIITKDHPMVTLDKLTISLPRLPVSPDIIQLAQQYQLADPTFHTPNRIDIILGASLFPQLLTGSRIQLGPDLPYLIDTPFGHVVMGTTPCIPLSSSSQVSQQSSTLNVCLHSIPTDDLHSSIQKFWVQEDIPSHHIRPQEDIECERLFVNTHSRDDTGRYVVRLPI